MSSLVPVHLLCLIHGMWGNPNHLDQVARHIREKSDEIKQQPDHAGDEFEVLLAQTNMGASTYDGIDWGGERIADEVVNRVKEIEEKGTKKVVKFSILGYSLGGLLARYVVGILQSRNFFTDVQPINFTTIATPHVGLPRYPSFWSSVTNSLGPVLLSRTGEQFFAGDQWGSSKRPLLEVMADPERIFLKALKSFKNVSLYANAVNDITVPYVTAAIETQDPFLQHETNGLEVLFNEEYKPVISSYKSPSTPPIRPPNPRMFSKQWWEKPQKPRRTFLPPFLQRRFPLNVAIYLALPLLIPFFISMALIRLSLDARASRARIKLLESAESESGAQGRLINILHSLEKEMDDAVANFVDDDHSTLAKPPPTTAKAHPILKPAQHRMIASLNTSLPHLKKNLAFIDGADIRNSHATIVSRDVAKFEFHKLGYGVLRHWSDGFEF